MRTNKEFIAEIRKATIENPQMLFGSVEMAQALDRIEVLEMENMAQRRKDFEAGIQTAFKADLFNKFLSIEADTTCLEFRDGVWNEYIAKERDGTKE